MRRLCELHCLDNELGFIMYADIENLDDPERRTIIAMRDRFEARIRTLLREAIKRGEIADDDVKLAGLTLLGASIGFQNGSIQVANCPR